MSGREWVRRERGGGWEWRRGMDCQSTWNGLWLILIKDKQSLQLGDALLRPTRGNNAPHPSPSPFFLRPLPFRACSLSHAFLSFFLSFFTKERTRNCNSSFLGREKIFLGEITISQRSKEGGYELLNGPYTLWHFTTKKFHDGGGRVDYENIMPRLRRVKGISRGGGEGCVYTLEEYRARQKRLRGWRFSLDLAKIHGKTSPLFASY